MDAFALQHRIDAMLGDQDQRFDLARWVRFFPVRLNSDRAATSSRSVEPKRQWNRFGGGGLIGKIQERSSCIFILIGIRATARTLT
jgi:hypothetical protein